jgi:hypothetical protein
MVLSTLMISAETHTTTNVAQRRAPGPLSGPASDRGRGRIRLVHPSRHQRPSAKGHLKRKLDRPTGMSWSRGLIWIRRRK